MGAIPHSRRDSGACLIAGFVGTSTGRGTRRRGNPGRPGAQGEPARLSDPMLRGFSDLNERGAGSRPDGHSKVSAGERPEGTGSGSKDGARLRPCGTPETRSATGYSRPSPGFALLTPRPRSEPQWPSPTRTWRGDEEIRLAGALRPLAQFRACPRFAPARSRPADRRRDRASPGSARAPAPPFPSWRPRLTPRP